ncbi:MAG: type 4a pilus biogenesis protein PilO [Candidatus Omnitrophica bacterium]|nr:type 4a pilus biogenesis protein PilO [Candidatus Omnitrophota bacterium]
MKNEKLNKYVEMLQNIDEKNRYYLFIGVLLLIFLLDYFVFIGPQLGTLMGLSPKISILNDDIQRVENDFKRIEDYRIQVKELKETLAEIRKNIKLREDVPNILEKISFLADKNGIKIDRIMPEPDDQTEILEKDKKVYYYLPIYIEARSTYHNFGRFLSSLEQEEIFIKTSTFSLASSSNIKEHTLKLTLLTIIVEDAKEDDKDKKDKKT